MGAIVFIVFLPVVVAVVGGLLVRGQGAARGPQFWIGMALLFGGAGAFLWVWLIVVLR